MKRIKVERKRTVTEMASITITGVTLLSLSEAKKIPLEIRKAGGNWWLRSPGNLDFLAAFVYGENGTVYDSGLDATLSFGVRPALKISDLESSDLQIGDKIIFGDDSFTVVSAKYALSDDIIGTCAFRRDPEATNANDYKSSDIKRFVKKWAIDNGYCNAER